MIVVWRIGLTAKKVIIITFYLEYVHLHKITSNLCKETFEGIRETYSFELKKKIHTVIYLSLDDLHRTKLKKKQI